jgi:hypothetical protein
VPGAGCRVPGADGGSLASWHLRTGFLFCFVGPIRPGAAAARGQPCRMSENQSFMLGRSHQVPWCPPLVKSRNKFRGKPPGRSFMAASHRVGALWRQSTGSELCAGKPPGREHRGGNPPGRSILVAIHRVGASWGHPPPRNIFPQFLLMVPGLHFFHVGNSAGCQFAQFCNKAGIRRFSFQSGG